MSGPRCAKGGWQGDRDGRTRVPWCPRAGRLAAWLLGLLALGALAGCGSNPKHGEGNTPGAAPKVEPKSRYGNMKSYEVFGRRYVTKASSRGHVERGKASWYGKKFHGRKTSSGERYDMYQMTAAHKTLPLPTYALVTNLENGRSTVVKVNDRGPFVGNRIIDLSYAAAKRLGMVHAGTATVEVRSIDPRDHGGKVKVPQRVASTSAATKAVGQRRAIKASAEAGRGSAAKPASRATLASAAGRPVYLQVGAFGRRGNALQLQSQLSGAVDQPVLVRTASTTDARDPLYKVQVGPLPSEADADALGRRLAALGIATPVVVTP